MRGLSRWRARFLCVGLDEELIGSATEKAGMLLLQVERFLRVLAIVMYQVGVILVSDASRITLKIGYMICGISF